jgi:thioredoxin 1
MREMAGPELTELIKGELPALVKFYAPWCAPCRAMEPVFNRLAESFAGRAVFAESNIDDNPDFANENDVRAVPTFVLFSDGKAIGKLVGATSEKALANLLRLAVGNIPEIFAPVV